MNELTVMLAETILMLIKETADEVPAGDPGRLRWMEIGPRSEEFADNILSCEIRHNDPSNPGGWRDSEVMYWPNTDLSDRRNPIPEIGRINQGFMRRYTIILQLFYSELQLDDGIAGPAAAQMMKRIHLKLLREAHHRLRLKDDFGEVVVPTAVVKHSELLGSGSSQEANFRGRFWIAFNTVIDVT